MKVRRTIGGALFGIGCAVTFVGILATVLPMVQNDQLQLVLSSFEMPSGNLIVSAVNGAMTYALHHSAPPFAPPPRPPQGALALQPPGVCARSQTRMAGGGCRLVGMEAAGSENQPLCGGDL